jgi:DNA-binding NarL/FixJ family response regulator
VWIIPWRLDPVGAFSANPQDPTKSNIVGTKQRLLVCREQEGTMFSDTIPIPVLIVDDHPVVRHGLQAILQTDRSLRVVGEAHDGQDALVKVEALGPRVVLMDVNMPNMDGLAATRKLKERFPRVAVVILTLYNNEQYIVEAVRAGAAGYLLKTASRDEISRTIHEVNAGGMLINQDTLRKALDSQGERRRGMPDPMLNPQLQTDVERLSPRELDVLRLVVEGMTNKDIGSTLYITEDTAKKHVQSIISKLQVSDRTQAAVKALRLGMVN